MREKRAIERVAVAVVVSDSSVSAPLGETRDVSLDGLFLVTDRPLRRGDVLPVSLTLPHGAGDVTAQAEVVRLKPDGVGLRFTSMSRPHQKLLRRFVVKVNSVDGTRDTVSRLHDERLSTTKPITDRTRIYQLLEAARVDGTAFRVIPASRQMLQEARVQAVGQGEISMRPVGPGKLIAGEPVLAIYTFEFVSYSFQTVVIEARGKRVLTLALPERIVYSERRSGMREAPDQATWLELPLPWDPVAVMSWEVLETSPGGLSFRASTDGLAFLPDTPMPDVALRIGNERVPLTGVVVRNVRRIDGAGRAPWLRVGVAHGLDRGHVQTQQALVGDGTGMAARLKTVIGSLRTRMSFLWHSRDLARALPTNKAGTSSEVVRFTNRVGQPLVGRLDLSFTDDDQPRAPLVVVMPGFGGRKEQTSYLASILIEGFRRNHGDVAVLRIDGTNNLGESYKDPGCEDEGKHNLHYTLGGVIEDLHGCLAWAGSTDRLEVTDIIVVSVSFSSCAVMHALAQPDAPDVSLWVAYMGAADPRDAVLHVSGHSDLLVSQASGSWGLVSLIGCMVDSKHFWTDMQKHGIGSLEEARRDMAKIAADTYWVAGIHDGWMDIQRTRDVMSVAAPGSRRLVEVDSGHVPRTGDEAVRQFVLLTQEIWRHVHGTLMADWTPSLGRLEAIRQDEWAQTRRSHLDDRAAFWRDYLLGSGGGAFDVLNWSPAYRELIEAQADLMEVGGQEVLDLGAGTGNLAVELHARHPATLTCLDLVPEALQRLEEKLSDSVARPETLAHDLDGTPLSAMACWRRGHIRRPTELARRIPGFGSDLARRLEQRRAPLVRALLSGHPVPVDAAAAQAHLPSTDHSLLGELAVLAQVAAGNLTVEQARPQLERLPQSVLEGPVGLPFPDNSFDRVGLSLVLSYLSHPEDLLAEVWRVLRPGGIFVLSSMKKDADTSKLFLSLLDSLELAPPSAFAHEAERNELIDAAREFLGDASQLFRLEEEGLFRFYDAPELEELVMAAGFGQVTSRSSFGAPPQAVITRCMKS